MKQRKKQLFGFTLLEILVAAGIILLLTSVGVVTYSNVTRRSRDARRTSDIEQIRQALEMVRADFGFYFTPIQSGVFYNVALLGPQMVPTYLPAIPTDPRGSSQPYQFAFYNPSNGQYYSYCIAARLESQTTTTSTCSIALPQGYNYGQQNP